MKKFLLVLIALFLSQTAVNAEEINLLSNAYNHPAENYYGVSSYFYNVWSCYKGDGTVAQEAVLPNSYFSKTVLNSSGGVDYYINNSNQVNISSTANETDMPVDQNLLVLEFNSIPDLNYNIPLQGVVNGDCVISGAIKSPYGASPYGFTATYAVVIFVANTDPAVPIKSMSREQYDDGSVYLKVTNANGVVLPSAFKSPIGSDLRFSSTMKLTPEHKYLTIFAPKGTTLIANLQLVGWDMYTGIEEPVSDEETAEEVYYDLSGRQAGTSTNKPSPGLYLLKKGSQTTKTLIR